MKDFKKIIKEDFEEWFESIPSYDVNTHIQSGALFLVNKTEASINYDILIRTDEVFDKYGDSDIDPDSLKVGYSTFNDRNKGSWKIPDSNIELSWANNLIDSKYWIPITKEDAAELFKEFPNYKSITESRDFDDLGWAEDIEVEKVMVVKPGYYYPTNTDAMWALGITGFEDFINKYGVYYWNGREYEEWVDQYKERIDNSIYTPDYMLLFLHEKVPTLVEPKYGDECYVVSQSYKQHGRNLYKLVRISDNGEFIMSEDGFKKIED
jgi:hypothetical protein